MLFGGSIGRNGYGDGKGETWSWDGQKWTRLDILQPANVFNASMVSTKEGILRFGGWDGKERINQMWILEIDQWKKLKPKQSPSARNHAAMVYNSESKQIMLYGGHDGKYVFGDLWCYSSGNWEKLLEVSSKPRISNGH